jgi:hypothetical protein
MVRLRMAARNKWEEKLNWRTASEAGPYRVNHKSTVKSDCATKAA